MLTNRSLQRDFLAMMRLHIGAISTDVDCTNAENAMARPWKLRLTWKYILVLAASDFSKVVWDIKKFLSCYEDLVFWVSSWVGFMLIHASWFLRVADKTSTQNIRVVPFLSIVTLILFRKPHSRYLNLSKNFRS